MYGRRLVLVMAFVVLLVLPLNADLIQINIIHINDSHSNLHAGMGRDANLEGFSGGIARAVSVIGSAKMQDPESLLLHGGDFCIGDITWYLWYGLPELAILKDLGLDAVTIGNHEFDAGTPNLIGIIQGTMMFGGVDFISSNLVPNTDYEEGILLKSIVKDNIIKEVKGLKIGIFGLTSASANMTSLPGPQIEVHPDYQSYAELQVEYLKEQGCDIIILLSHIGWKADIELAENVQGINVILGAHDHLITYEPLEVVNGEHTTYIAQSGSFYQNVGLYSIEYDESGFVGLSGSVIHLTADIPEETTTKQFLDSYMQQQPDEVKVLFNTPIAMVQEEFTEKVNNIYAFGNKSTHVGCLVSQAFKEFGQTDLGITTSGLTAQPLYPGPIVGNDVCRMMGYGVNELSGIGYGMTKYKILGSDLYLALLFSFVQSYMDDDDEFFPQIYGAEVVFDPEIFQLLITVNGEPLNPEKYYTVTTSIFVRIFMSNVMEIELKDVEDIELSDFQVVLSHIINAQMLSPDDYDCQTISVNTTSIFETIKSGLLNISPNPANDHITIKSNILESNYYNIEILDLNGMKNYFAGKYYFDGNEISINTSTLSPGVYFIKMSNQTSINFGKFIIVK